MNALKSMMLIGLGVGGTIAYQKYSKTAMKEIEKVIDKTMKKASEELDEMM